jgi:transcriptional regulator with XRE-family HTH domain
MPYKPPHNASVTLRHAIARDREALRKGSRGGAAEGPDRKDPRYMDFSLNSLLDHVVKQETKQDGAMTQVLRNRKSAFLRALELVGASVDTTAKMVLGPALAATESLVRTKAATRKAASDMVSSLRWWHRQADTLYPGWLGAPSAPAGRARLERKFRAFLREHMKAQGLTIAELARRSGIPLPTVQGWLHREVRPSRSEETVLESLAEVLKVPVSAVLQFARRTLARDVPPQPQSEYSAYLEKCSETQYVLGTDEVLPQLRQQWNGYLGHQAGEGCLARSDLTGWRLNEWPENRRGEPKWFENYHGQHVPAACANWRRTSSFLGFLRLPTSRGGAGLDLTECQTLALLAVPRLVKAHLAWWERRAGEVNSGQRNFRQVIRSLCARKTGWLRQQPELLETLPERFRDGNWDDMCDEILKFCAEHTRKKPVSRSRDPFEPIRPLLRLPDPGQPIFDLIDELTEEAASFRADSLARAIALRDAAQLALLMIVPVRLETFFKLTVGTGGHFSIKQDRLHLKIPGHLVKNGDTHGPLRIDGLESELLEPIKRYLEVARPRLLRGAETNLMFISAHNPTSMWVTASMRLVEITYRHLSNQIPQGIPMQSFRHLVASRYLKLHPGEYQGVATLLHDSLQTVLDTYAPADPTNAFERSARRAKGGNPQT